MLTNTPRKVTVALRGGLSRQHYALSSIEIDKTGRTALVVIDGRTYGYANVQSMNIREDPDVIQW